MRLHSSRRVVRTLAQGLYTEGEQLESTAETAKLVCVNGNPTKTELSSSYHQIGYTRNSNSGQEATERIAHNIGMRLKCRK